MSIMPMKKCQECGYVFSVDTGKSSDKCPECGSEDLQNATTLDLIRSDEEYKKVKK